MADSYLKPQYRDRSQDNLFVAALQWRPNEHGGVSNHQLTIVYSTVYSGADQRKHESPASLAFVRDFTRDRYFSCTNGQ